jgi:hypothetical protein
MGNRVLWTLGALAGVLLLVLGGIEHWRWKVDRDLPINDANLRAWRFFRLLHKYAECRDIHGGRPRSDVEIVKLSLFSTNVTDTGLKDLAPLTNRSLVVHGDTQATR